MPCVFVKLATSFLVLMQELVNGGLTDHRLALQLSPSSNLLWRPFTLYNALDNVSFHSVRQFSSCFVLPVLSLFGKHMSLSRAIVASGCQVPLNLSTDGARVYSYDLCDLFLRCASLQKSSNFVSLRLG